MLCHNSVFYYMLIQCFEVKFDNSSENNLNKLSKFIVILNDILNFYHNLFFYNM